MTDQIVVGRDRSRGISVILAILGIGLVLAGMGLSVLIQNVGDNKSAIEQAKRDSAKPDPETLRLRRELSEVQRLVQGLQGQVRDLGGVPLTTAPTPQKTAQSSSTVEKGNRVSPTTQTRSTRSPRRPEQPQPSSGSPSPSPSPSPRPTCLVQPICLPPRLLPSPLIK